MDYVYKKNWKKQKRSWLEYNYDVFLCCQRVYVTWALKPNLSLFYDPRVLHAERIYDVWTKCKIF